MVPFHRFAAAFAVLCWIAATPAQAQDGRWRRIETEHFMLYSDGGEGSLRDAARDLESFDNVLRTLLPPDASRPPAPKLNIYLFGSTRDFHRFSRLGASAAGFYTAGPELVAAFGEYDSTGRESMEGRQVLFHEYTHHYMMQYFNDAYPAWFVEGLAEYLGPTQFRGNNALVGLVSDARVGWFTGTWLSAEEMLGADLRERGSQRAQTYAVARFYAQSWLMTHYFMSDAQRREGLWRYLGAVAGGADPIAAFEPAFGFAPEGLREALNHYAGRDLPVFQIVLTPTETRTLTVERLPAAADDLMLYGLELRRSLSQEQAREYLEPVERAAAQFGDDPMAQRVLASAKIRTGDYAGGRAILERLIAANGEDGEALYLMGRSYLLEADAGEPENYAALAAQGRPYLLRAYRANTTSAPAAYYYAQTYYGAPGPRTDDAFNALMRAHLLAPQVSRYGVELAARLMEANRFPEAVVVLAPIANAPHESGMSRYAATLLEAAERNEMPPADTKPEESEDE